MIFRLLLLARERQTRMNTLYLLVAFPLGLLYFIILIVGLTVGVATLIVWIGIPILLLTLLGWWSLARFERNLAMGWLHVSIPPMSLSDETKKTRWERLRAHLNNRVTWKSLIYLLLKFPLGTFSCYLALTLLILMLSLSLCVLSLGLIITPFLYLAIALRNMALYVNFLKPLFASRGQQASPLSPPGIGQILLLSLTGCGFVLAPFYLLNGMAWAWGQFSRVMLGMSDNAIRLAEAEALAQEQQAKAERAEQSRRELIINVSHELRTPVASIRGHVESLLIACGDNDSTTPSPAVLRNYLNIVHREALRLGSLVDDLLALARTEASELSLNMSAVEAAEVVEEVYQTLMPLARRERQITIVRNVTAGLPPIMADRQRLVQVLLNLVRNAITYTPDGGIISISLQQTDAAHLALSVSDTGIGIPPEEQERIFERFYRTDASRTRATGGFGLGLAIVRDFVNAMGGTISVESVVGEGSCFRVLLQVAPAPHAQVAIIHSARQA